MAEVNVTIGGRHYRMACDDGQEEHLVGLAHEIGGLIEKLRGSFGEIGDQRLTMMAAITMADQHAEAERAIEQLRDQLASAEAARAMEAERFENMQAGLARAVEIAAQQIEAAAHKISGVNGAADESSAA
jgi:cell division protein ZapA